MLQIPSNPVDTLRNSLYKHTSTSISFRREITNCSFKKIIVWQGFKAKQDFLSCRHVSFSCFQRCGVLVGWLREVGGRFFSKLWQLWGGLLQEGDGGLYMVSWCQQLTKPSASSNQQLAAEKMHGLKKERMATFWPNMFWGKFRVWWHVCLLMLFTQNSEIMMGWLVFQNHFRFVPKSWCLDLVSCYSMWFTKTMKIMMDGLMMYVHKPAYPFRKGGPYIIKLLWVDLSWDLYYDLSLKESHWKR